MCVGVYYFACVFFECLRVCSFVLVVFACLCRVEPESPNDEMRRRRSMKMRILLNNVESQGTR